MCVHVHFPQRISAGGKESACNVEDPGLKIPWRGEQQLTLVFLPGEFHGDRSHGGLQSVGSQRVRHDWATNTSSLQFHFLAHSFPMRKTKPLLLKIYWHHPSTASVHTQVTGGLQALPVSPQKALHPASLPCHGARAMNAVRTGLETWQLV